MGKARSTTLGSDRPSSPRRAALMLAPPTSQPRIGPFIVLGPSRIQGQEGVRGHGADKARGCESDTAPRGGGYGEGAGTGGERHRRNISDVSDSSSKRRTHAKVGRRKSGIHFDDECFRFREYHVYSDVT